FWSFGLTDEVFATTLAAAPRHGVARSAWSEAWMAGIALSSYLSWVGGTLAGGLLGGGAFAAYPIIDRALGFMLPALFISLLASLLSRGQLLTAVVAGAVCLAVAVLASVTTGILVGMVVGALASLLTG